MSAQTATLKAVPQEPADPAQESSQEPPQGRAPAPDTAAVQAATPSKRERIRKTLIAGAAVALLATASWYGWDYWSVGRFLVSTDDAYVKADNTTIAPKVSGYLNQVLAG